MLVAGFPSGALAANCYVLSPAGGSPECVVVDAGQACAAPLADLLAEHRLQPVAVLLTHGHLDHVAGAREVCARYGIPAYLHGADDYMLTDPLSALSAQLRSGIAAILGPQDDLSALRPDDVRPLDGAGQLELAGLTLAVDHTPGHTGGSVTYRIAGDGDRPELLLTGDTLFAGSIGRTDLPGGSLTELLTSIELSLLSRPDGAVVLPGHGPSSTIGRERSTNPFL